MNAFGRSNEQATTTGQLGTAYMQLMRIYAKLFFVATKNAGNCKWVPMEFLATFTGWWIILVYKNFNEFENKWEISLGRLLGF